MPYETELEGTRDICLTPRNEVKRNKLGFRDGSSEALPVQTYQMITEPHDKIRTV